MARVSYVLIAALALAAVAGVRGAAYPTTQGLRYLSYTMQSNVTGYTNMTQDICDLQKAVLASNRTAALDIYLNGKNSVGGSGLRKFMTWATAVHAGEPYFDMLAARYGPNFTTTLNDTITKALTSGDASLGLSLILVTVQSKYSMHEVDAAYRGVSNNNTNATSGPAHNLDEAWAIFTGAHPDNCTAGTLISLADDFGKNMATVHSGQAETFWAINVLMNELQYYALTGNSTVGKYNGTAAALRKELATVQAQIVLGGAYASELYAKCRIPAQAAAFKNLAFAAWWPLSAQLSAWKATSASLQAVETAVTASTLSYSAVKSALLKSAVLRDIDVADIGLPVQARLRPSGCTATVTP